MDSLPDAAFVRVAALAARLMRVPVAVVQVRGGDHGLPSSAVTHVEGPVAANIDPHALADPRSAADLGLEFHASVPLTTSSGRSLGTLSVHDRARRTMEPGERAILDDLATVAVEEIDVWLAGQQARDRDRALAEHRGQLIEDTAALMAAMREVTAYEDPSAVLPAICRIARTMTGADSAAIYEIDEADTALVPVVSAGGRWPLGRAQLTDTASPPVRAFLGGKPVLVEDDALQGPVRRRGRVPALAFWQPFAAGGPTSAAVIGLTWDDATGVSGVRLAGVMDVLAMEALRALERAQLLVRLEDLALTDELTGLPNRRALNAALAQELERARREGHDVCVGLLDLDRFKQFNDTRGHPAGDRLLADAAAVWRDALRGGTDVLGRFGGEEFLVVLPTFLHVAVDTVERLRAATPEGQTASVGVAAWDRDESSDELIARADAALYVAKQSGRDRIECAPTAARPPLTEGALHEQGHPDASTPRSAHGVSAAAVPATNGAIREL